MPIFYRAIPKPYPLLRSRGEGRKFWNFVLKFFESIYPQDRITELVHINSKNTMGKGPQLSSTYTSQMLSYDNFLKIRLLFKVNNITICDAHGFILRKNMPRSLSNIMAEILK